MGVNRIMPSLSELYLAYRQAKVALYFERRGVGLVELAQFEENLSDNLVALQQRLRENGGWFQDVKLGQVWVVPKRIRDDSSNGDGFVHIGTIDAATQTHGLDVQFRLSPSPEFVIMEVLYLQSFGPALEKLLRKEVIGYRLDLRNDAILPTRRWLFEYWPTRYQEFRAAPLEAARKHLARDGDPSVLVVSADLASFYDTIAPSFMLDAIPDALRALESDGIDIDVDEYVAATTSLLHTYGTYLQECSRRTGIKMKTGVPIGALTSRLVANLALAPLDDHISALEGLLCYRRYVDDLIVVLGCDSTRVGFDDVLAHILPLRPSRNDTFEIDVSRLGRDGSEFCLQRRKVRIHHLAGVSGKEFVDAVESDFSRLVSERRAFLDTSVLLEDGARHLVRVGREAGSPLRVFRDADRAHLERFALSTSLNSLERVSTLISRNEAQVARTYVLAIVRMIPYPNRSNRWWMMSGWLANSPVIQLLSNVSLKSPDSLNAAQNWGTRHGEYLPLACFCAQDHRRILISHGGGCIASRRTASRKNLSMTFLPS